MNRRNDILSWVEGNDVLLVCWLYEQVAGGNGRGVFREFPLEEATSLQVTIHNARSFREVVARRVEGSANGLVLSIPAETERGRYSVRVKAMLNGAAVASFESPVFSIVATNAEANTVFERIGGSRSASFSMDIAIVGSAVAAGKNAYELWLEAGNSGTLDDFLNQYVTGTATHESDGMMSAEDKTDLDAIKDMKVLGVTEATNLFNRIFNPITD
ncbi:MAG: hypothetical protein II886_13170 [Prevotella sp.]|nr:hypothetical protein [Prevotella sp.]